LPPDGQPIVLLGDCGTIGGYPRIGHVASVDLPRLAQLRPGETMRFVPAALAEADRRACARNARVARIALAIQARNQRPHA
jgi:antagonist of KipI